TDAAFCSKRRVTFAGSRALFQHVAVLAGAGVVAVSALARLAGVQVNCGSQNSDLSVICQRLSGITCASGLPSMSPVRARKYVSSNRLLTSSFAVQLPAVNMTPALATNCSGSRTVHRRPVQVSEKWLPLKVSPSPWAH